MGELARRYRPDTVIAAYDWLMNGSTNYPFNRVYTAAYRMEILKPWMPLLAAKGHRFTAGVAANGNVDDAEATLELARDPANGILMVEGINESNTNFGSGEVPPNITNAVQDCLWKGKIAGIPVAGPSIVFGLPYPEGYISPGYCSAEDIAYLNERMDIINGHFYPPNVCDLGDGSDRGGCFDDVVIGLRKAYGSDKPISLTEWQPTLYGQHGTDDHLDGYYTPWMMLSAWRLKLHSMMCTLCSTTRPIILVGSSRRTPTTRVRARMLCAPCTRWPVTRAPMPGRSSPASWTIPSKADRDRSTRRRRIVVPSMCYSRAAMGSSGCSCITSRSSRAGRHMV